MAVLAAPLPICLPVNMPVNSRLGLKYIMSNHCFALKFLLMFCDSFSHGDSKSGACFESVKLKALPLLLASWFHNIHLQVHLVLNFK